MEWVHVTPDRRTHSIIAIVAGVATGAVLLGLMEAAIRFIPEASPWKATVGSLLTSLSPIFPGFAAGWMAGRKGFAVGAAASGLTSILYSVYVSLIDSRSVVDAANAVIPDEVTFAVAAIIVGGICGIAGAAVAKERWNAF